MSKNLVARIAVAAVAIPVILWISFQGGMWLCWMLGIFATLAMTEYLLAEGILACSARFALYLCACLVTYVLFTGILESTDLTWSVGIGVDPLGEGMYALGAVFLVSAMMFSMGKGEPAKLFERTVRLMWGVAYVAGLYALVFHIGSEYDGVSGGDWLMLLFGILWIGDTAAMFTGKAAGKRKLAPAVSPNKTVEGFVGGVVGAVVYALIFWNIRLDTLRLVDILVIAIGCSMFGQLGDLAESMWKRSVGVKDSSAIIPGHGGVLDRFDSLLFAAPFLFAYTRMFL